MMPAPPEQLVDGLLQLNLVGPPSTATVRRDLLREVGDFDEHLSVIADWDLGADSPVAPRPPSARSRLSPTGSTPRRCTTSTATELDAELEYLAEKHSDLMPEGERFGSEAAARKAIGDNRRAGRRLRAAFGYLRMGVDERSRIDVLRGVAMLGGERTVARLKSAARPEAPEPEWLTDAIGGPAAGWPSRTGGFPVRSKWREHGRRGGRAGGLGRHPHPRPLAAAGDDPDERARAGGRRARGRDRRRRLRLPGAYDGSVRRRSRAGRPQRELARRRQGSQSRHRGGARGMGRLPRRRRRLGAREAAPPARCCHRLEGSVRLHRRHPRHRRPRRR